MSDTLKKMIELSSQLNYEENEALRSHLFSINYHRKEEMDKAIKALSSTHQ